MQNSKPAQFHLQRILAPVDLSFESIGALQYTVELAQTLNASITVLHVVQLNIGGEELGIPRTRLLHQLGEEARIQLQRSLATLCKSDRPVRLVIVEGHPHEEILDQARKLGADLIVMASHRHTEWLCFLHPRTVAHVLREAPCPVLVVGSSRRRFPNA